MRYQSSFYGPLIGILFCIASTWAQEGCSFVNTTTGKIATKQNCGINENAVNGTVITCFDGGILVKNLKNLTVDEDYFAVRVTPDSKLQVLVNANLTEVLNREISVANRVEQYVRCDDQKKAVLLVVIQINAENNNIPEFDKRNYQYQVIETAQANHLINPSPIVVVDRDYRHSDFAKIDVTITAGNEGNIFKIDTKDDTKDKLSRYTVKLFLNRAGLPYKKEGYTLTLMAKDKGEPPLSSTAEVTIEVIDVADQDPIFNHPVYSSNIYVTEEENKKLFASATAANKGEEFKNKFQLTLFPEKLFAYDQDLGINAPIRYELITEGVKFSKHFHLGKVDPVLDLTEIDGDLLQKGSISLLVKACQDDDPKRHAFALVNIQITMKPFEIQPIFTQDVELLRSQQENFGFYNIQTSGKNSKYEIKGPHSEMFNLVGNEIRLKAKLPKETQKLEIEIHAKNEDSLIATNNEMKVIFNVVEIKKLQDPLFDRTIYRVDVWSDTAEQKIIFTIKALEERVTYELTGGDTDVFKIDRINGHITLEKKLQKDAYSLKVTGTLDGGSKADSTEVIFNVVAKAPTLPSLFTRQIYQVDIVSDAEDKSTLFTIETTRSDVDVKIKDTVPQDGIFELNSKEIILSGKLDPSIENYTIHAVGRIEKEGRTEDTTIIVHVIPKKKTEESLFTREIYEVDITSDLLDQHKIFKPATTDTDVIISIEKTDPADAIDIFHIDSNSIILNGKLDFTVKMYTLYILGTIPNQGKNDTSKVNLHVIEVNRPTSLLFSKSQYSVDVPSSTEPGKELFSILTETEGVKIEIIKTDPADALNFFQIDTHSIILNRKLDHTVREYTVYLLGKIEEKGKNDTSKVILHVIEVNRPSSLIFAKSQYIVDVLECTEPGTEIYTINTTKEAVKMEIIGGDKKHFEVSDAGSIKLLEKLQLQTAKYEFEIKGTVRATNETDKTKVSFSVIKCGLANVHFEKCVFSATIQENTASGHVLAKFNKEQNVGKYTIKSEDDEAAFDVQQGSLVLKKAARDLKKEAYYIVVSATANDEEVLYLTAPDITPEEAVVIVLFERSPQFLHSSPLVKVFSPSAPLSDYAFQVNVKTSWRQATFSLSDGMNNFAISSLTGLVYPVTDITKIEGFHTVLQVTAQFNEDLKDTLDIHVIRLKRIQTLMMTSASTPEYTNVENIMAKLSHVSKCEIIPLQYQAVDQKQKSKFVKRSPVTFFSENADSKLVLVVAALKDNKPLSLQEFENLFEKGKLIEEVGVYEIEQLPEPGNGTKEVTVIEVQKQVSNGGLVAAVAILGAMVSLMVLGFVGVFVYKHYWPMLKKTQKDREDKEESVLKRWKPPTPPQRRIGKINPETSPGVVNGGLVNDTDHLYIEVIPDYAEMTTLSSEIKDNKIPAQEQPIETENKDVAIAGQITDDIAETSTIVQSNDENAQTGRTEEREARKSVVTFSEQADIIP